VGSPCEFRGGSGFRVEPVNLRSGDAVVSSHRANRRRENLP
jgi:hypothetical protein